MTNPTPTKLSEILAPLVIASGEATSKAYLHQKWDEAETAILKLISEARVEELRFGLQQLTGLDKSHVGGTFYNRNTAFKNYAVKFWNNRMTARRSVILDRIKQLTEPEKKHG